LALVEKFTTQLTNPNLNSKLGPFKNPKDGESQDGERRKKTSKDVIFIKLHLEKSTIIH